MSKKKFEMPLTTVQASRESGLSTHTLRKYIERRLISAQKIGGIWFFDREELRRYAREKKRPGRRKKS